MKTWRYSAVTAAETAVISGYAGEGGTNGQDSLKNRTPLTYKKQSFRIWVS